MMIWRVMGARKPGSQGEHDISVKTIVQGMPDDSAEPCMGSKLSRGRRLLAALFCAEVRRGQGWPKATAGGGASAALSATNSAPKWCACNARGGDGRQDVMRGLGRE